MERRTWRKLPSDLRVGGEFVKLRVLLLLLLSFALSACSRKCEREEISGVYASEVRGKDYELRLAEDGSGLFTRDQSQIGVLRWEMEPCNGQVFLKSDREVLNVLRQIADEPAFPSDTTEWRSGYRGVTPRCGLSGTVRRLELDVDGQKYLTRRTR